MKIITAIEQWFRKKHQRATEKRIASEKELYDLTIKLIAAKRICREYEERQQRQLEESYVNAVEREYQRQKSEIEK